MSDTERRPTGDEMNHLMYEVLDANPGPFAERFPEAYERLRSQIAQLPEGAVVSGFFSD